LSHALRRALPQVTRARSTATARLPGFEGHFNTTSRADREPVEQARIERGTEERGTRGVLHFGRKRGRVDTNPYNLARVVDEQ
jgi:hypothetical protein